MFAAGTLKSGPAAVKALKKLAGLEISESHLLTLTRVIGEELAADREARTQQHADGKLKAEIAAPPSLAAVFVDGGRVLTRAAEQSRGVHDQAWKETKVACLTTMASTPRDVDPHPELPTCFTDRPYVDRLVRELKSLRGPTADTQDTTETANTRAATDRADGSADVADSSSVELDRASLAAPQTTTASVSSAVSSSASSESAASDSASSVLEKAKTKWQPIRLVRTCIATLAASQLFGPMVAAEAQRRGFFQALRRAFVGDGQAWNWTLQQRHFPTFTPILDFVHLLSYLYEASRALAPADAWSCYLRWATACWLGRGCEVWAELRAWQTAHPSPEEKLPDNDPRSIVAKTTTYLGHNLDRIDYPEYRRLGLPVVSALVESLIKEFNYRVKGSEKFWNRPTGIEPMLQVRAAALCDDTDRLSDWILHRPGSAFYRPSTNARHRQQQAAIAV